MTCITAGDSGVYTLSASGSAASRLLRIHVTRPAARRQIALPGHYPHTHCRGGLSPLPPLPACCRHTPCSHTACAGTLSGTAICCCANDERWCWGVGWYGSGERASCASRVVRTSPSPSPSDRRRHTTYRRPLASRYPSPLSLPPAAACRLPLPPPLSERRGTGGVAGTRRSSHTLRPSNRVAEESAA